MSRLLAAGVGQLVVAGPGAAIVKLLRNMQELSAAATLLALPWDRSMDGEDLPVPANSSLTLLVPQVGSLPTEFVEQLEECGQLLIFGQQYCTFLSGMWICIHFRSRIFIRIRN